MKLTKTVNFLKLLRENNNRDWFHANKSIYAEAKKEFEDFVNTLIPLVTEIDSSVSGTQAKNCIFRIYRDVRFSHDKRPYKTNFGAYINEGGKKSINAGYYIHIEPNGYFAGGGIYMPPTAILTKIRTEIIENTEEYISIIENEKFIKTFGQVEGEKLKSAPRGFSKDLEHIDLIKFKSYTVTNSLNEKDILSDNFMNKLLGVFKDLKDFNQFLNDALK